MKTFSCLFLLTLVQCICIPLFGQLEMHKEAFLGLAEISVDQVNKFDEWETTTILYPSGRVQDEVRTFVSSGCKTDGKCTIRYQHQVYYDMEESTFALKEGKYYYAKNGKASFRHYGWWYNNNAKVYRSIKEKTTKKL